MASLIHNSLSVVSIILLTAFANSYKLHRSIQDDLTSAAKILQRQKRHSNPDQYIDYRNIPQGLRSYDALDLYNKPRFQDKISLDDILAAYPELLDGKHFDLSSLGNSQNDEEIVNVPVKKEKEKVSAENSKTDKMISESKISELLKEVAKDQAKSSESSQKETESEATEKPEPVTKEELQDIFSESSSGSDAENEKSDGKEHLEVPDAPDSDSEEEKIKLAQKVPQPIVMKKRDAKINPRTVEELESEIALLRDELTQHKLVEDLEDKENDYLAAALKEATMAQLNGKDLFLRSEYGDIQNAIDIEELLQDVKTEDTDSIEDEIATTQELAESAANQELLQNKELEAGDLYNKRNSGSPEEAAYADSTGQWMERPVQEDTNDENEETDAVLENLAKEYLNSKDRMAEQPEAELDEADEEPALEIGDDDGLTVDEGDVDRALANYIRNNIAQPQIGEDEAAMTEECPAVELFSSNCKVAESLRLPIDIEARDLCNRHELCYACGATLGISGDRCDAGFRSEVIEICGTNKNCIRDGAEFLWLIKGDHRYNYGVMDQCAHACVEDYIIGL